MGGRRRRRERKIQSDGGEGGGGVTGLVSAVAVWVSREHQERKLMIRRRFCRTTFLLSELSSNHPVRATPLLREIPISEIFAA